MEKEINHVLPFLDVLLDNTAPHFPVTTTYRKKTFTGVLTNFLSFTPLCYKLGLVKTLIDRIFKINNTWLGFHKDIQTLFVILRKNLYPEHVLNSIIHRYISKAVKGDNARPVAGVEPQESPKFYFKIPYIGRFSGIAQHRVRTLVNRFCKPVDIKLVFSTFKIKNLFNVKDPLPDRLRTRVVYKFSLQVVMLVTSVKQADTSLRASESTYRRTDLRTSLNIYRVHSLVASHVQQIVSQF